jgi:hypothetical protein
VAGGSSRSIGTSTSWDGTDVAAPDRELDPRDEARSRTTSAEATATSKPAVARRHEQQGDAGEQEQRAGHELGRQLAAVDPTRARLHESSRRRSAASSLRMSSGVVGVMR